MLSNAPTIDPWRMASTSRHLVIPNLTDCTFQNKYPRHCSEPHLQNMRLKKMFKEIGQFNSSHKKPEFLVEVVQSNRRSIPPRIKPNREQGTVREQHALSFLLEFFRREVWEDRARFVPFDHGVWIRRLGSWSSSSQILRIERISCPANFNCEPFLFTLQVDLAPIRMSGLTNRSKKFALVRSTSQLKILPEEVDLIGRDSLFIWSCACRGADIDISAHNVA